MPCKNMESKDKSVFMHKTGKFVKEPEADFYFIL